MAPDDRERDAEEQPRVRITDRRRFANLGDDPAAPAEGTGAALGSHDVVETIEHEATEVAGDLQVAQSEARTNLDRLLRLQAEFDNYRKRVAKEQAELSEMGAMPVARRLLEVLDDFELALMSAEDQPDFDRFLTNSLVLAIVSSAFAVGISALGAYAFSRYAFKWRHTLLLLILIPRLVPRVS
ncbi:MAG: nucleotide exchange factor GrpE, partial [Actinomycetota bacterium]